MTLAGYLIVTAALLAQAGSDPPLPPGLETPKEEPALPPGLEAPTEEPALPPGLGAPAEEPALPPGLGEETVDPADDADDGPKLRIPVHGFVEVRGGLRIGGDPAQPRDAILGEARVQLETSYEFGDAVLDFTGDLVLDGVLEEVDWDQRELRVTWSPFDNLDLRIGRQVNTWGTGDLLFLNDLFPKDWNAFLAGRDEDYLKAPANAIKVGWFNDWANVEVVYTPRFAPDRYISGDRVSFWNPLAGGRVGRDDEVDPHLPRDWFDNDEIAVRVYRNFGAAEVALYGYFGYWKSPGGQRAIPIEATFPKLNVYGASVRAPMGKGIANAEIAYYDSRQDSAGRKILINNSEFRLLLGYEQEIGKELTAGVQAYWERMLDYDAYRDTLPFFIDPRDEDRVVLTLRLTKLLMNQDLTLSLFTFYSPTDNDAFIRPKASYKITDAWRAEVGANIFFGENDYTFYNQFEDNSNVYAGLRWSF